MKIAHSRLSALMTAGLLAVLAPTANALTISAGEYTFVLSAFDSGTTGYGTTTGNQCANAANCDLIAANKALGSIGSTNSSADTMGIFSVQSITKVGSFSPVFVTGGPDGFLTGIFGNLVDYNVNVSDAAAVGSCTALNPGGCITSVKASGGTFQLWKNSAAPNGALGPAVTPTKDLNDGKYPTISDTGVLYLSGVFSAGAILGDATTTFSSSYNNGTIGGQSLGYIDLVGGSAFNTFNTDAMLDPNGNQHDLFASFEFKAANGTTAAAGWNVTSTGAIEGAAVPEPGTMSMAALALLGLAGLMKQRRRNG